MRSHFHKILVLGNTGNGKSTFCNYILSYPEKKCKESELPDPCTFEVNGYPANENSKYNGIFMIDTPGLNDGKGRDQEIINKIRDEFKAKYCEGIKSIIIVENVTIKRISFEAQRQLSIYCRMFQNPNFWEHVGFVFSFSSESWPDEQIKDIINEKQRQYMKSVRNFVEEETKGLNKNFKIPNVFPSFFTDCGKVYPPFTHKRTDEEIDRLISWTRCQDYIDFDENDLNAVYSDYKSRDQIEDEPKDTKYEDLNEDEINEINNKIREQNKNAEYLKYKIEEENIQKEIVLYCKRFKVKDFYNRDDVITEKKPYTKKIYYLKQMKHSKNEQEIDKPIGEKKLEKITVKKKDIWLTIVRFEDTGKEKEKIKDEFVSTTSNDNDNDKITIKKTTFKVVPELTQYKYDPHYIFETIRESKDSKSAVQEYFERQNKIFGGRKNLIYFFDFATFFLGPIICTIIDWFRGVKPKWIICGRRVGKVNLKKETEKNEFGAIKVGDWVVDETIETWEEYEKPYLI